MLELFCLLHALRQNAFLFLRYFWALKLRWSKGNSIFILGELTNAHLKFKLGHDLSDADQQTEETCHRWFVLTRHTRGQTLGGSRFHIDQLLSLHFDSVNMHVHSKARALSKPTRVVQIFLLIQFSKKMKRYQLHQFYNCEISSRLPSCHYITIWKPDSCDRVWKTPNVRWRKSRSKLKRNNNNYNDHKESNLPCYCLCRRNNSIL